MTITINVVLHVRCSAEFQEAEINPKRFDYNDLRVATRNFHEDMKLGAGGYGVVYKVNDEYFLFEKYFYLRRCI